MKSQKIYRQYNMQKFNIDAFANEIRTFQGCSEAKVISGRKLINQWQARWFKSVFSEGIIGSEDGDSPEAFTPIIMSCLCISYMYYYMPNIHKFRILLSKMKLKTFFISLALYFFNTLNTDIHFYYLSYEFSKYKVTFRNRTSRTDTLATIRAENKYFFTWNDRRHWKGIV